MILSDIFPGQPVARKILTNSIHRNRVASTYLFCGKEGTGKWSAAIWLTAMLNCHEPVQDDSGRAKDPCGSCLNCRQIFGLVFPELYFALPLPPHKSESEAIDLSLEFLETKRKEPYAVVRSTRQLSIPIKTAREIKRKTSIKPDKGKTRVVLFYGMEKMLHSSADSLLKLIEEPPPETIIILTAQDPESLLPTIQSRSQKIAFKALSQVIVNNYLKTKYDLPEKKSSLAARLSEGSIGQALTFIEEEGEDSLRQVSFLMFKSLFHQDTPSSISAMNELIQPRNRGVTEQNMFHWQSFLGDIILLSYTSDGDKIVNIDLQKELESLSGKIKNPDCYAEISKIIKETEYGLKRNAHIRPAMIDLAIRVRKLINQSA